MMFKALCALFVLVAGVAAVAVDGTLEARAAAPSGFDMYVSDLMLFGNLLYWS
jgi:hypothetical protein